PPPSRMLIFPPATRMFAPPELMLRSFPATARPAPPLIIVTSSPCASPTNPLWTSTLRLPSTFRCPSSSPTAASFHQNDQRTQHSALSHERSEGSSALSTQH